MKQIMSDPEMKSHGQEISGIMHKFRREEIPEMVLTLDDEYETLKGAQGFFEKEFGARIDLQKTLYSTLRTRQDLRCLRSRVCIYGSFFSGSLC